ncbi:MAG: hypothetical protein Q9170_006098 [Blastenia crenularia]
MVLGTSNSLKLYPEQPGPNMERKQIYTSNEGRESQYKQTKSLPMFKRGSVDPRKAVVNQEHNGKKVLLVSGQEVDLSRVFQIIPNYLHLTKRFGIIAASQLPLHYLLAFKSPHSPISILTRLSHEQLNPYHRALGRIILLFLSLHASFYLNFYIQKSLLRKRIQDPDVLLGLLAFTTFITLTTTALAKVRQRNYFLFFTLHVLLSISLLPTLYFHVSHLRIYILESVAIYLLLILQRNISQKTLKNATLNPIPGTSNLISITIPLPPSLQSQKRKSFHPAQHIYLSLPTPLSSPQEKLRLNPFTVANLPHKDKHIRLVLRALNGTTNILSTLASKHETATTDLLIEGPYGAAANFPNLMGFDKILLVAGGVGATFTMPLYRDLVDRGIGAGRMRFVWVVREVEDARWGVEYLTEGCEVYCTGRQSKKGRKLQDEDDDEGIELQERTGLMEGEVDDSETDLGLPPHISLHRGRPDFSLTIGEIFAEEPAPRKLAVLVCGPAGMATALRSEVGRRVGKGVEVFWHNEEFGW